MTNFVDVFGGQVTPPSEYGYQATTIASNTTAYWPYNYAGTGLVLAKNNDITASAASLALTLPNATEVSTGEDFIVKNAGSNSFEVKDNAGNTLTTITAGVAKYFVLTNNSTAAGVYDVTTFGTGTSSADAGILAGAGHRVDGDAIDNIVANNSIGATYSISASDNATTLVYKSGTATLALPSPSSLYNGYFFIFINEGSGTVTLDPSASVTIDGSLTKDLQPGESCIVTTDGVLYYTAGYGRSNTYVWTQLTVDLTGLSAYTVTPTQAQNKLWYFFNAPVSSMTVTIPSVASVYFLRVGAIGGYTLTFTTGSGATVGLTANQSYIIYCDGTNITAAQTVAVTSTLSLVDGSAASPSLYFSLDTDTGIYRKNTNQLAIAAGGVQAAYFDVGGLYANVTGNVTGDITGNAASATTVAVTNDAVTAGPVYPAWVSGTSGNRALKVTSTKLTFDPLSGNLATTGDITATLFNGSLIGNATSADNIDGGVAGNVPYQSAPNTTAFLSPGTNGYVLTTQGPGLPPTWSAGVPAATAANIVGGGAGRIVYQNGVSSTAFTAVGSAGEVLTSNGTGAPTWSSIGAATDLAGGLANEIPYQTAPDTTSFITAGTPGQNLIVGIGGAPEWSTPSTPAAANGINSATTTVNTSAALAPTNNKVLTATSGTSATWQYVGENLTNVAVVGNVLTSTGAGSAPIWTAIPSAFFLVQLEASM
jgi:hypothetical protein